MNDDAPAALRTPVVATMIGACLFVFLLQMSGGQNFLLTHFALWPPGPPPADFTQPWRVPEFQPWQLLSYAFLHGGIMHLFLNLFGLWMFGTPVERVLGSRRFALFLLICVLGAAIAQLLALRGSDSVAPTIGASGGVLGILPAFALLFPRLRIQLLFPPIAMRAPVFVLVYGAVELLFGVTDTLPGIAHFAHLGGMLTGGALLLYWLASGQLQRPRLPF